MKIKNKHSAQNTNFLHHQQGCYNAKHFLKSQNINSKLKIERNRLKLANLIPRSEYLLFIWRFSHLSPVPLKNKTSALRNNLQLAIERMREFRRLSQQSIVKSIEVRMKFCCHVCYKTKRSSVDQLSWILIVNTTFLSKNIFIQLISSVFCYSSKSKLGRLISWDHVLFQLLLIERGR